MTKWICNVCGYIHEGDQPPEVCPVCGVGPDQFSKVEGEVINTPAASEKSKEKRWKCTVCDYIHIGEEPPEHCPVCNVGPEFFVLLANTENILYLTNELVAEATEATAFAALDKISYGLYIVSSAYEGKLNGQCANTMFQLTSKPQIVAACLNKRNLTHDLVNKSGQFAVSILGQEQIDMAKNFGYKSGHNVDKFAEVAYINGRNECPILKQCLAYLECRVMPEKVTDVGTHTLFIAEVIGGRVLGEEMALTYALYCQKK